MATELKSNALGWGNQPRVLLYQNGLFFPPEEQPIPWAQGGIEALKHYGDGLYRMAMIVDDQSWNPFNEAKVGQRALTRALSVLKATLEALPPCVELPVGLEDRQCLQLRAAAAVVLLSIAESQKGRTSKAALALVEGAMTTCFAMLERETSPILIERMAINLDWVVESLPKALASQAKAVIRQHIPDSPPYAAWFADDNITLSVDWKCGSEFLTGWKRRLQEEKFLLVKDGGELEESTLTRTFQQGSIVTRVEMNLGPERNNVFRKMGDVQTHIVGYDGHSDWGRKIPRSLLNAPKQAGSKVILYLLCCGKQVLQKVRDTYPAAPIVTTFNSSKFTTDFRYSEDFTAFMHILTGFSKRETWPKIRERVNKDWYNNPEGNYLFPDDPLVMARSLDRDHDGQADMFDKLIDFNTFDVLADARAEFTPRIPETPLHRIVGTRLHFAVQVFHTLGHFNQVLEPFTRDLRVFSRGWFDPTQPVQKGVIERGPTRVRVDTSGKTPHYFFQGSVHFAHATEEAWRALGTLALAEVVLAMDGVFRTRLSPEERAMTALLLVAHGLEVDDAWGRDEAVWRQALPAMGLKGELPFSLFMAARKADSHWYAGSKQSFRALRDGLANEQLEALRAWAQAPYSP